MPFSLIFSICLLADPKICEERNLTFSDDGVTDLQCSMGIAGQKQIAEYMARYPNKFVSRWKCRRVDNFAKA